MFPFRHPPSSSIDGYSHLSWDDEGSEDFPRVALSMVMYPPSLLVVTTGSGTGFCSLSRRVWYSGSVQSGACRTEERGGHWAVAEYLK